MIRGRGARLPPDSDWWPVADPLHLVGDAGYQRLNRKTCVSRPDVFQGRGQTRDVDFGHERGVQSPGPDHG